MPSHITAPKTSQMESVDQTTGRQHTLNEDTVLPLSPEDKPLIKVYSLESLKHHCKYYV